MFMGRFDGGPHSHDCFSFLIMNQLETMIERLGTDIDLNFSRPIAWFGATDGRLSKLALSSHLALS